MSDMKTIQNKLFSPVSAIPSSSRTAFLIRELGAAKTLARGRWRRPPARWW
jgi:hypothetical protein